MGERGKGTFFARVRPVSLEARSTTVICEGLSPLPTQPAGKLVKLKIPRPPLKPMGRVSENLEVISTPAIFLFQK